MFTGIVEEIGTVETLAEVADGWSLTVQATTVLENTRLGDSLASWWYTAQRNIARVGHQYAFPVRQAGQAEQKAGLLVWLGSLVLLCGRQAPASPDQVKRAFCLCLRRVSWGKRLQNRSFRTLPGVRSPLAKILSPGLIWQ